jgi:hypothetical protein
MNVFIIQEFDHCYWLLVAGCRLLVVLMSMPK